MGMPIEGIVVLRCVIVAIPLFVETTMCINIGPPKGFT